MFICLKKGETISSHLNATVFDSLARALGRKGGEWGGEWGGGGG